MRKSPRLHRVDTCIRKNHVIHSYIRGKGSLPNPYLKRELLPREGIWCGAESRVKAQHCGKCGSSKEDYSRGHEPREYSVLARYVDGGSESIKVVAHSPEESIHFAMMKFVRRSERPIEITSKNGLGDIVGKIAGRMRNVSGRLKRGVSEAATAYSKTRTGDEEKNLDKLEAQVVAAEDRALLRSRRTALQKRLLQTRLRR